jgi:hypothetical protein
MEQVVPSAIELGVAFLVRKRVSLVVLLMAVIVAFAPFADTSANEKLKAVYGTKTTMKATHYVAGGGMWYTIVEGQRPPSPSLFSPLPSSPSLLLGKRTMRKGGERRIRRQRKGVKEDRPGREARKGIRKRKERGRGPSAKKKTNARFTRLRGGGLTLTPIPNQPLGDPVPPTQGLPNSCARALRGAQPRGL